MNLLRDEIEEKGWQSIDALLNELEPVIVKHAEVVPVYDIQRYIDVLLSTVYRHAREHAFKVSTEEERDA